MSNDFNEEKINQIKHDLNDGNWCSYGIWSVNPYLNFIDATLDDFLEALQEFAEDDDPDITTYSLYLHKPSKKLFLIDNTDTPIDLQDPILLGGRLKAALGVKNIGPGQLLSNIYPIDYINLEICPTSIFGEVRTDKPVSKGFQKELLDAITMYIDERKMKDLNTRKHVLENIKSEFSLNDDQLSDFLAVNNLNNLILKEDYEDDEDPYEGFDDSDFDLDDIPDPELSVGEQIASYFAGLFNSAGGVGPFGGEDVIPDGDEITLTSQSWPETYRFNNDGSVDFVNIEHAIDDDPEMWLAETDFDLSDDDPRYIEEYNNAVRDIIDKYGHFDSVKDLLYSGLSWFDDYLPISRKDILKEIDNILLNGKISDLSKNGLDLIEDIEKHDTLNPKLFDGEELKPEVKEAIEKIVDTFVNELAEDGVKFTLKDIVLLGSNVSYNYTKDSDLDIHLIADSSDLHCPDELYPLLYSAYRSMFNKNYDITIKGIPAELYVEMDEPAARSNGIYSLNTGWLKKPVQQDIPDLDQEAFDKLFNEWEEKYFELLGEDQVLTEYAPSWQVAKWNQEAAQRRADKEASYTDADKNEPTKSFTKKQKELLLDFADGVDKNAYGYKNYGLTTEQTTNIFKNKLTQQDFDKLSGLIKSFRAAQSKDSMLSYMYEIGKLCKEFLTDPKDNIETIN